MISKVLQTIVNGVKFGVKESFMTFMNDLIDMNMPKSEAIFNELINLPASEAESISFQMRRITEEEKGRILKDFHYLMSCQEFIQELQNLNFESENTNQRQITEIIQTLLYLGAPPSPSEQVAKIQEQLDSNKIQLNKIKDKKATIEAPASPTSPRSPVAKRKEIRKSSRSSTISTSIPSFSSLTDSQNSPLNPALVGRALSSLELPVKKKKVFKSKIIGPPNPTGKIISQSFLSTRTSRNKPYKQQFVCLYNNSTQLYIFKDYGGEEPPAWSIELAPTFVVNSLPKSKLGWEFSIKTIHNEEFFFCNPDENNLRLWLSSLDQKLKDMVMPRSGDELTLALQEKLRLKEADLSDTKLRIKQAAVHDKADLHRLEELVVSIESIRNTLSG